MWISALLVACGLVLGAPGTRVGPDELDLRLQALSSATANERRLAERWLGVHLRPEDFERVARTLQAGDAEVRHRLGSALGTEGRHLGLAARLSIADDALLREVGERALESLAARWNPDLTRPGLLGSELWLLLHELAERQLPQPVQIDLGRPVDENLELLARHGRLPLGVFREVQEAPSKEEQRELWSGTWPLLLRRLAERDGLLLEGFGLSSNPQRRSSPGFVHLRSARRLRTGVELLRELVREGLTARTSDKRRRSFEALAATRWPAAVAWLEERWLAGDQAAREALLFAAEQGRVADALVTRDTLRRLLARADELLAEDQGVPDPMAKRAAHRILDALSHLPCLDAEGGELAVELRTGWEGHGESGRWLRLVLLEAWRCDGPAARELSGLARELLVAPSGTHAPKLLRQALRASAPLALDSTPPASIGDPDAILNGLASDRDARGLVALLVRSGAAPPDRLADPEAVASWDQRACLALAVWWLERGDVPVARRHVDSFTGSARIADDRRRGEVLAAHLERLVRRGRPELVRALLDTGDAGLALERALFLSGALLKKQEEDFLTRALADPSWTDRGADLALLGVLGGRADERGRAARDTLLALLGGFEEDSASAGFYELSAAFERSIEGLFSAGQDRQARQLARRLARARDSLGVEATSNAPWPPPPRVEVHPLEELDRRWP